MRLFAATQLSAVIVPVCETSPLSLSSNMQFANVAFCAKHPSIGEPEKRQHENDPLALSHMKQDALAP